MHIFFAKTMAMMFVICTSKTVMANAYVDVRTSFSDGAVYFSFEHPDTSKIALRVDDNAVVILIKDKFAGVRYSDNLLPHTLNGVERGYPRKSNQGVEFIIPISFNLTASQINSDKNYIVAIHPKSFSVKKDSIKPESIIKTNTSQNEALTKDQNKKNTLANIQSYNNDDDKKSAVSGFNIASKKPDVRSDNFPKTNHENPPKEDRLDIDQASLQHQSSTDISEHRALPRSVPSPGLAEASVDADALPLAASLLEQGAHRRLDREAQTHAQYLKGQAALRKNDRVGAHELWNALTRDPSAGGLMATLSLAEDFLNRKLDVPEDLLRRLAALTFEWRGDVRETAITLTLAKSHDAAGRPAAALETLARVLPRLNQDQRDPSVILLAAGDVLRRYYCGGSPKAAPGDTKLYWDHVAFAPENPVGDAIRLCYAATLEDQDLLELAAGVLRPVAESGRPSAEEAERRLATLALRSGKPREALALLRTTPGEAGPPDRERDVTAAEAYAAMGRYDEALARLAPWTDAEASDRKADYAWRAGSWAEAAVMSREAGRRAGAADRAARAEVTAFRGAAAAYMAGGPAEDAASPLAADDPARSSGAFITSLPSRGNLRGRALAVIEQAGRVADLADLTGIGAPRP